MKIVIAMDSLKGSLTSMQAGEAAKEGILRVFPDAKIDIRPLADGGEGTVDALVEGMHGSMQSVKVTGPIGKTVTAHYGILPDGVTAVMEMSQAAGITLVPEDKRNPLETTTYGVGEMIHDALQKGCRRFIVGIGGSATNDGGAGMLQALGFDLLDLAHHPISHAGKGLEDLTFIETDHVPKELADCEFQIACDVTNPLCGPDGCSAVFGPQKGADENVVRRMDAWLASYAKLAKKEFPKADANTPGSGAAGGLGFAFCTFLDATLESGIDLVIKETRLESYIQKADLVLTGEGQLDEQTAMGKAPVGVARLAKKYHKPVLAFCGSVTKGASACNEKGIDAFFPIVRKAESLEEAMKAEHAFANMEDTVEQAFRLLTMNMK